MGFRFSDRYSISRLLLWFCSALLYRVNSCHDFTFSARVALRVSCPPRPIPLQTPRAARGSSLRASDMKKNRPNIVHRHTPATIRSRLGLPTSGPDARGSIYGMLFLSYPFLIPPPLQSSGKKKTPPPRVAVTDGRVSELIYLFVVDCDSTIYYTTFNS